MKTLIPRVMVLFVFFELLNISVVQAGVTGKILGKVVDKSSGEALPGVNVYFEELQLGAATDENGMYLILEVPPGTYTLHFSMIGYKNTVVKNVHVNVDHTTKVNVQLEQETLNLNETIIVTAKRPIIQKDVTSSTQFVGEQQLIQLPVTDAKEGIFLQAGIFFNPIPVASGFNSAGRGEARYSVRGGSQDQVKWFINGIRTSAFVAGRADWGGSFTDVNLDAIKEVQVITGGFNAEYGEAQSGIVNVITKEGGEKFSVSVDYMYGLPGKHHFGNYLYDRKTQKEFIDHTLANGKLDTAWWTPYRRKQIYDYRKIPDHVLNLSFGGHLFKINGRLLKFFISSQFKEKAYNLPHPRNTRNLINIMGNMSYRILPQMKLRLSGIYSHDAHSTWNQWGDFALEAKYYRGWGTLLDKYTYNLALHLNHTLTSKLFYELKMSYFLVDFKEGPSKYTVLGKSETRDIWGFQYYEGLKDEGFHKYAPIIKNHKLSGDLSLMSNLNWQFDKNNLAKTGFELHYNIVADKGSWRFPSYTVEPDLWINRGLGETFNPIQFAAFLQDKMEFESMILNIGLRYDYFYPNYNWFKFNPLFNLSVDPRYDAALDPDGDQVDANGHVKYAYENVLKQPREPAKSYQMISPRLGVSFPISEKTLMHFNYGHFYQMPPMDEMFEFNYFRPEYIVENIIAERKKAEEENRTPRHIPSNDGDPERVVAYTVEPLRPQKTIMFEVGIKHNFVNFAVLDVTAYYKDQFDQTDERIGLFDRKVFGYDPFREMITPNNFYTAYFPGDYGDSRGFEVNMRTLFSRYFSINLNYTFSRAVQGRASPAQVKIDKDGNMSYVWDTEVNKRIPTEKGFSRPHILRVNLFFNYPKKLTDTFTDIIFKETKISLMYRYVSGQAFTYLKPNDPPDTYDNYRYPGSHTVDLKMEKVINLGNNHGIGLYTKITNLLNAKNLRSIGDRFFMDPNLVRGQYVKTGKPAKVDLIGRDISWQTYYEPRRFYFGVRYFFN